MIEGRSWVYEPRQSEIGSYKEIVGECKYFKEWISFSDVYRSINYIGSRAKWMNPEGVHVNFASDSM